MGRRIEGRDSNQERAPNEEEVPQSRRLCTYK